VIEKKTNPSSYLTFQNKFGERFLSVVCSNNHHCQLPKFFGKQNLINRNFPLDNSLGIVTTLALKKIFIDSFGQTKTSFLFKILLARKQPLWLKRKQDGVSTPFEELMRPGTMASSPCISPAA
jgi:hypothetical protein